MNKRKSIMIFVMLAVLILSWSTAIAKGEERVVTVYSNGLDIEVNGKMIEFTDTHPYIDSAGRTMVPARFVAEEFGYSVEWDEPNMDAPNGGVAIRPGNISIYYEGMTVYRTLFLFPDSNIIQISDGDAPDTGTYSIVGTGIATMDTNVTIRNDRTYLPLRYISELLGYTVVWNSDGGKEPINPLDDLRMTSGEYTGDEHILSINLYSDLPPEDVHPYIGVIYLDKINGERIPSERVFYIGRPIGNRCTMYNEYNNYEQYTIEFYDGRIVVKPLNGYEDVMGVYDKTKTYIW